MALLAPSPLEMTLPTLDGLDEVQRAVLLNHAQELRQNAVVYRRHPFSHQGLYELARSSGVFALVRYVFSTIRYLLFSWLAAPGAFFVDPLSALYASLVYTVLTVGLVVIMSALILYRILGLSQVLATISQRYGGKGLSICSWMTPGMFFDNKPLVAAAIESLAAPFDEYAHKYDSRVEDILDLDVARFLLCLSSLVYERDESLVALAPWYPRVTALLLRKSEALIEKVLSGWPVDDNGSVRYCTITDFTSVGGSYACAFYGSAERPWICIVFKGTTPTSGAEFITDANLTRQDAGDHFAPGVEAHNGFYSALFNVANSDDSISPYRRLLITIRAIVRHLHKGTTNPSPIPLWVSGHSLGAGQAALLYHRFLTAPGDLGHDVVLRDCYAFGTPRTFNATGASAFEKLLNDEKNQGRNLFRFAHGSDPVAWLPPGLGDQRGSRTALGKSSLFNFAHIGQGLHLTGEPPFLHTMPELGGQRAGHTTIIVEKGVVPPVLDVHQVSQGPPTPITLFDSLFKLLVPPIHAHMPSSYYLALAKASGVSADSELEHVGGTKASA